jgi:cytoskeletal protein RodZ
MKEAKRGLGSYRFVCISLAGALGLALSACGGDSGSATTGSTGTSTPSSSSSSPSSSSPSSPSASNSSPASGTSTSAGNNTAPSTTVNGPNVTLNWTPPTQNTDGSPLTDLIGYRIHYGNQSQSYTSTVSVDNPGIATYVVQNLPAGQYYFAVTAYNSAGLESQLSDEVSAKLN